MKVKLKQQVRASGGIVFRKGAIVAVEMEGKHLRIIAQEHKGALLLADQWEPVIPEPHEVRNKK